MLGNHLITPKVNTVPSPAHSMSIRDSQVGVKDTSEGADRRGEG